MKFNWKRVVNKEYGTTFNGGTMILLLLAWESYCNFGYASSEGRLKVLAIPFFLLSVALGAARYMEKTQRLKRIEKRMIGAETARAAGFEPQISRDSSKLLTRRLDVSLPVSQPRAA